MLQISNIHTELDTTRISKDFRNIKTWKDFVSNMKHYRISFMFVLDSLFFKVMIFLIMYVRTLYIRYDWFRSFFLSKIVIPSF